MLGLLAKSHPDRLIDRLELKYWLSEDEVGGLQKNQYDARRLLTLARAPAGTILPQGSRIAASLFLHGLLPLHRLR